MLDIFRGLKNLLKVNRIQIDGTICRLHYNVTVLILISFSILITTKQFVGNPIECVHGKDETDSVVNTYCWIQATYTMMTAYGEATVSSKRFPYPGLEPGRDSDDDDKQRKFYKYYQWVGFTLFFQAVLFYIPRWIWKAWEGGKIAALTMDLNVGICTDNEKKQKKRMLVDYLRENLGHHNWWTYRYLFCECLNLLNVLGQMWLMDHFFDREFITYGIRVIEFGETDQGNRLDPMVFVFPRVTKCNFQKYGPSGSLENKAVLCILPLNVLNEKIYIFLWFWFIILSFISSVVLIGRLFMFSFSRVTVFLMFIRFRYLPRKRLDRLRFDARMGDWFLFYMLGRNLDTLIFKEVVCELAERIEQRCRDTFT